MNSKEKKKYVLYVLLPMKSHQYLLLPQALHIKKNELIDGQGDGF